MSARSSAIAAAPPIRSPASPFWSRPKAAAAARLLVDAIQGQRQVVIKSLEANYRHVPGIAAATILGDGRVALILDVDAVVATSRADAGPSRQRSCGSGVTAMNELRTDAMTGRELIAFRIGAQEFCVDIMAVREIRGWTPATPLPQSPAFVRGVINLRGAVLPIVDLRRAPRLSARPSRRRAMSSSSSKSAIRPSACSSMRSPTF